MGSEGALSDQPKRRARWLAPAGGLALAEGLALAAIVAGAVVLRVVHLAKVVSDPYYDSAIRSMGLSWHNFLFGALEPGGTVSLDKPPLDLWPAVVFSKLFGFSLTTIRLPEALAGAAGVGLLYLAVRAVFGARAALGSAAALAVLPIEVITARSDTTDAIMMALTVLALCLVVRAVATGHGRWLLLAAAAMGIAFNVKLTESWLALAPLALIALLGLPRGRLRLLMGGASVYVAVTLSWLTVTLLVPAHSQPYAVGSTNGSPWDAAFVFNGVDRLKGVNGVEGHTGYFEATKHYPHATESQRNAVPVTAPSPTRLLVRFGPLSGQRLGLEALVGLLLGIPAGLLAWRRRGRGDAPGQAVAAGPAPPSARGADQRRGMQGRARRAVLAGLLLWLAEGVVLFSDLPRLHPRYTEALTPAAAAMVGVGVAWVTAQRSLGRSLWLGLVALVVVAYTERLLYGTSAVWWIIAGAAVLALALSAAPVVHKLAFLPLLCCVLASPLSAALGAVNENASDGNVLGFMPKTQLDRMSSYLTAHERSAYYETAYDAATRMGALVLHDARPVLALTTVEGHVIVTPSRLHALVANGRVRYAILARPCTAPKATNADCSAPVEWVRQNGSDISSDAGLPRGILWQLQSAGDIHPR